MGASSGSDRVRDFRGLSPRARTGILLTLISVIGLFYVLTIRPGQGWGDDFAMYVLHARNIALSLPYADTGYIYNPHEPQVGPRVYPPVFPLMLAPVYRLWGMNLEAMKVEVIAAFAALLLIIERLLRGRMNYWGRIIVLAVLGFNPYFWEFKDSVLSDIPFTLFVFCGLWVIDYADGGDLGGARQTALGVVAGFLIALAFGTRTVGLVLVPVLAALGLWRCRQLWRFAVSACLTALGGILILQSLVPGIRSYGDQWLFRPEFIAFNLRNTFLFGSALWWNGCSMTLAHVLSGVIGALAVAGFIYRCRVRVSVLEVFIVAYLLTVVVWPASQGLRFYVPILPLYVFYAASGAMWAVQKRRQTQRAWAMAGLGLLLVAMAVSYGGTLGTMRQRDVRADGPYSPESMELFAFVRTNTAPDDVFIFFKPRALALYTGRRASVGFVPDKDEELVAYLQQIGATHLVVRHEDKYLRYIVTKQPERFTRIFANSKFMVCKITYDKG